MDKLISLGLIALCIFLIGRVKRLVKFFILLILVAVIVYALKSYGIF